MTQAISMTTTGTRASVGHQIKAYQVAKRPIKGRFVAAHVRDSTYDAVQQHGRLKKTVRRRVTLPPLLPRGAPPRGT